MLRTLLPSIPWRALTKRNALSLNASADNYLFLHAELGVAFAFNGGTEPSLPWIGPFSVANAVATGGVSSIVQGRYGAQYQSGNSDHQATAVLLGLLGPCAHDFGPLPRPTSDLYAAPAAQYCCEGAGPPKWSLRTI